MLIYIYISVVANNEAWNIMERLQVIDRKSEKVKATLQKFQDDLTSLRQINGITGDHYKALFADIIAIKKLLKVCRI